jgi:hypothetical protein
VGCSEKVFPAALAFDAISRGSEFARLIDARRTGSRVRALVGGEKRKVPERRLGPCCSTCRSRDGLQNGRHSSPQRGLCSGCRAWCSPVSELLGSRDRLPRSRTVRRRFFTAGTGRSASAIRTGKIHAEPRARSSTPDAREARLRFSTSLFWPASVSTEVDVFAGVVGAASGRGLGDPAAEHVADHCDRRPDPEKPRVDARTR